MSVVIRFANREYTLPFEPRLEVVGGDLGKDYKMCDLSFPHLVSSRTSLSVAMFLVCGGKVVALLGSEVTVGPSEENISSVLLQGVPSSDSSPRGSYS